MRLSWQYIAGFFDGEGCITTSTGMSIRVTITQTGDVGFRLLSMIREFVTPFGIRAHINAKPVYNEKHTPCWHLVVSEADSCVIFLHKMIPFLHVKKVLAEDKARLLIWYATKKRYQRVVTGRRLAEWNGTEEGKAAHRVPNSGQFKPGNYPARWSKKKEVTQ